MDDDLHEIFREPRTKWSDEPDELRPLDREAGRRRKAARAEQEARDQRRKEEERARYLREEPVRQEEARRKAEEAEKAKERRRQEDLDRRREAARRQEDEAAAEHARVAAAARRRGALSRGRINRETNGSEVRDRVDAVVYAMDPAAAVDLLDRLVRRVGAGSLEDWQEPAFDPRDDLAVFIWSANLTPANREALAPWLEQRYGPLAGK